MAREQRHYLVVLDLRELAIELSHRVEELRRL
jgi:hypothetical protein